MSQLWKKIQGFENYSVSDDGLIRNDSRNKLKAQRVNKDGYNKVSIYENGNAHTFRVHRLVAEAFIDNPLQKPDINHIDGNKTNNNCNNLEWVTKSENMIHAYNTGLAKGHPTYGMLGKKNPNAGRHGRPVRVLETGEEFSSVTECSKALNLNDRAIYDVLNGRQNSHRGYHFERI